LSATNGVGTTSALVPSLPTIPSSVPGAPTITGVTRHDESVDVAFNAPGSDGGFPILSYAVSCTSSNGGAAGSNSGLISPITVSGLTNGRTYTCTATATNLIGTGPASAPSASFVPGAAPDTPAQPTVQRGDHLILVSVGAPDDNGFPITSYTASCTSLTGTPGSNSDTAPPVTVTGLTNGATYTCTITATNAIGTSGTSLPSLPVTPAAVPDPPTITGVTRGNQQITVAFTAGDDNGSPITSFSATCTSSNGGAPGSDTGTASPIVVTGLTNGSTYTCVVRATNAVGQGPQSDASDPVVPATVPSAPAAPTATRGDNLISVAIAAPANGGSAITSFGASCTSSNGGAPGSGSSATSPVTVTGLTNGRTYTCTATATNAVGTGGSSPASNAVIPAAVPDVPAAPSVTRGNGVFFVAFSAPGDNGSAITSYTATCTSTNGGVTRTQSGTGSPLTVSNISTGKTYRCTVTATNGVGMSPPSAQSAIVVGAAVPGAPTIASVAPSSGAASVIFGPAPPRGSEVTSYTASCTSSNGGSAGSKSGAGSPLAVTGLTNGKTYTCTVTGTNAIGTGPASAPSNSFVVGNRPGKPVNVRAVPGPATNASGPLRVSFKPGPANGSAITSYRARCRSLNGGVTGTRTGTRSPLTVSGLSTGKTYLCTVNQTTASGSSVESSPARATVGAPAPPAVLRRLPLAHGLALPFTPPADNGRAITEFRSRCFTNDNVVRTSPPQTASPLIATNLTDGKSYVCVVTARNARGLSPQTAVAAAKAGRPNVAALASCTGDEGSVNITPGLATSPPRTQTFKLSTTLSDCAGPYVTAASLSISFRSSTAISCGSARNVNSSGTGKIRWTAPRGMGKTELTLRFVLTSTSGHTTKAHVYGDVRSKINVFAGSHVSGDLTLDRGLKATSDGGNCSSTPLTSMGVTAIKLRFS
jgi:hypothetical protein